jgi:geranylgeranyl transferase type-2 subunit beta
MDLVHSKEQLELAKIIEWVATCRHENGGYSAAPGHDPHLLATLSAVQILTILESITPEIVTGAAGFVQSLQQPDGSFQGDKWGEIDTRFSFCALACLALIKQLHVVDVDNAASFIVSSMNFDGGFGVVPGSESHAGQVYCCVGALKIAGQLYVPRCVVCLCVWLQTVLRGGCEKDCAHVRAVWLDV